VSLSLAKEDKTLQPSELENLPRSKTDGFDYRAVSNGLVFPNQDFTQLPYEIVVSYEHWVTFERCDNGLDDDADGQTDCADTDCAGQPCGPPGAVCVNGQCQ
jgi:hypothetical protein